MTRALYWMDGESGKAREAVESYLRGGLMTREQICSMRAYLCQWIDGDGWAGPGVAGLRARAPKISSRKDVREWLDDAMAEGIDPI